MRRGDDIAERLLDLAVRALEVMRGLPKDGVGRHIGMQLVRAATAGGANYQEARSAESRPDFIHKIGLATKELGETLYWLRLIARARMCTVPPFLLRETDELIAILTASARTARANAPTPP